MRTARLIRLRDLDERDLAGWRELAEHAIEPNPFFDPDFVLPAARGLGEWDDVAVVSVQDGSDWTACLPVRRYRRWHRLPLPCVSTWLHPYCLLGTPLIASERASEDLNTILKTIRGLGGASFFALEWVPADGSIAEALEELVVPIPFDRFSRAVLRRRPDGNYLDGHVNGKDRREILRRRRGLTKELGGEPTLYNRTHEPGAVEAFLTLEASGWKGTQRTAIASDPSHVAFFSEMVTSLAERDAVELLFLEAGGKAVAARCSLIGGGASFCFKVAYDEQFSRYAPGRELELHLIDQFHAEGKLGWMDSCADTTNELYNRLWPDRRELVTIANPMPGALGLLARPGLRSLVAVRNRTRRRRGQTALLSFA